MSGYFLAFATDLLGAHIAGSIAPTEIAKGSIIDARHGDDPVGAKETLPRFVRVYISDAAVSDIENYQAQWIRAVDWQIVNSDLVNDVHSLRLYATNPGTSGKGAIVKSDIESLLLDYNCSITSDSANQVDFDVDVFMSLTSKGFWGIDAVKAMIFTYVSYTQSGGVHTIQADYSNTGVRPINIDRRVRKQGATIVSHSNEVIVFTIARSVLNAQLKSDVKSVLERSVQPQRYKLSSALVDVAMAAGGVTTITLADLQANLVDDAL